MKRNWKSILGQLIVLGLAFVLLFMFLYPACQYLSENGNLRYRQENLHAIGKAILRSHDAKTYLPQAICRANGRPLLSWRVAILPFLEDRGAKTLYQQFKLDEPWDSPNNYPLLNAMPDIYKSVGSDLPSTHTLLKVFVTGPGYDKGKYRPLWPITGPNHLRAVFSLRTDPSSSTILAAEVGIPVPWTKPEDIIIDETIENDGTDLDFDVKMIKRYGSRMAFYAVMADGSVRTIINRNQTKLKDKQLLRPLIGYCDGEAVGNDVLD